MTHGPRTVTFEASQAPSPNRDVEPIRQHRVLAIRSELAIVMAGGEQQDAMAEEESREIVISPPRQFRRASFKMTSGPIHDPRHVTAGHVGMLAYGKSRNLTDHAPCEYSRHRTVSVGCRGMRSPQAGQPPVAPHMRQRPQQDLLHVAPHTCHAGRDRDHGAGYPDWEDLRRDRRLFSMTAAMSSSPPATRLSLRPNQSS